MTQYCYIKNCFQGSRNSACGHIHTVKWLRKWSIWSRQVCRHISHQKSQESLLTCFPIQCISFTTIEIRAPGAFFRNVLFSQITILSAQGLKQKYLKDLMTASDGDGDTRKKRRLKIWPQMQRTVYYTSADDQRGQSLAHLLTQYKNMYVSDEKSEKELSIEMQKRYLYVMFQQTLDIFDPLYVPSTAEEKKILVESGGWRRLKQKYLEEAALALVMQIIR